MGNLAHLFEKAVATASDNRGKPAILGKSDGTLYFTDANGLTHRTRVWARVGEQQSNQEVVVDCLRASPQLNMPVRVDHKNGRLTVVDVDDKRAIEFSGGRNGATVPAHAWLHNRLGPDPVFIEGLQYLPLLVTPTPTPDLTVTVQGGAYLDDTGALKIHDTAVSGSLSAFVPGSGHHFVIVCLDITDGSIVLVDGSDVTVEDALFGDAVITAADIEAVSISADYKPLAVVLLYAGQTTIVARDIVKDLRTGGGGAAGAVAGSDTQVIFNDGGAYAGDSGFIYNKTTDIVGISSALATGGVSLANTDTPSFTTAMELSWSLNNSTPAQTMFGKFVFGNNGQTAGSEYGTLDLQTKYNGTLRSRIFVKSDAVTFNDLAVDSDFIVKGTGGTGAGASGILKVDAGLGAVQFNVNTPGDLVDFRSSAIVFNNAEGDVNVRIAGNGVTNGYFYDAGNNRHGFGTGSPAFPLHVLATEDNVVKLQRSVAGNVVFQDFYNPNTTDGTFAIWRFQSDTTGAGATADVTFGNIFCEYDVHDHATRTGKLFFRTADNGSFDTPISMSGNGIHGVGIGIGLSSPATSAKLEIGGTNGAVLLPRLTTTQRNALSAANGMIIYNTTNNVIEGYENGAWVNL